MPLWSWITGVERTDAAPQFSSQPLVDLEEEYLEQELQAAGGRDSVGVGGAAAAATTSEDLSSHLPSRWEGPCSLPDWWEGRGGSFVGNGAGAVALAPASRRPQPGRLGAGDGEVEDAEVEHWASTPWASTFDLASVPYLVDAKLLVKQRQLQVWGSEVLRRGYRQEVGQFERKQKQLVRSRMSMHLAG